MKIRNIDPHQMRSDKKIKKKTGILFFVLFAALFILYGCSGLPEDASRKEGAGKTATDETEDKSDMEPDDESEAKQSVIPENDMADIQPKLPADDAAEIQPEFPMMDDTPDVQPVRPVPALALSGDGLNDFIPQGWILFDSAELDFNEDGIADYVGVLEYGGEEENVLYTLSPRILFAVSSKENGQYRLEFQDANLIRSWSEGGIHGDPYLPLTAQGKSFTTHCYGGSAWRWSEDFTYTYKDGDWYLTASKDIYGYHDYITSYCMNDYIRGKGIRKERSDEFHDMDENIEHAYADGQTGQISDDDIPYDLVYEVSLDAPMTLHQASMRWQFAVDRITDWETESVEIAEGIDLTEDEVELPDGSVYFQCCNEEQAIYTFVHDDKTYLASYRYPEKKIYILAQEPEFESVVIYQDKIYYGADVNKMISYRIINDGIQEIQQKEDTVGLRLYRMNLDGTDKEILFEYFLPIEEDEIQEPWLSYLSLNNEINNGKMVVEVYIGDAEHPFYRMDTDGSNVEMLGTVPAR